MYGGSPPFVLQVKFIVFPKYSALADSDKYALNAGLGVGVGDVFGVGGADSFGVWVGVGDAVGVAVRVGAADVVGFGVMVGSVGCNGYQKR